MDFVSLTYRFNSSWPWPESSGGLDPMYGEDGWCRRCGVPQREQRGSMVLQASKLPKSNLWMPNWQFAAACVREPAARELVEQFRVRTMPVHTPSTTDTGIVQLLPVVSRVPWYEPGAVEAAATARHGEAGRTCQLCGTWRWLPVLEEDLPSPRLGTASPEDHFVASLEWFGDGYKAFRHLYFHRPLAEALVTLNPRVWSIVEPVTDRR